MKNESIFTNTVTEWQACVMSMAAVAAGAARTTWGAIIGATVVLLIGCVIARVAVGRRKVSK